jgi:hypothetical protein
MTNPLDQIEDKPDVVAYKPQLADLVTERKKTPVADKLRELGVDPISELVGIERAVGKAYSSLVMAADGTEFQQCDLEAGKFRAKILEYLQNQLVAEIGVETKDKSVTILIPVGFDDKGEAIYSSQVMGSISHNK